MQATPAVLYDELLAQVIEDSRAAFDREGLDTNVLSELAKLWKEKLVAAGVGGHGEAAGAGGYAATGGWEDPSSRPAEVKQEWGGVQRLPQQAMGGAAHSAPLMASGVRIKQEAGTGLGGLPLSGLPQTDGAEDDAAEGGGGGGRPPDGPGRAIWSTSLSTCGGRGGGGGAVLSIEQVDGGGCGPAKKRKTDDGDDYNDGDQDGGDDDEELGSEDDEDEEELDTDNLVLCQYDKVSRTKTKWKAVLHSGLVHLNLSGGGTRDIVFKKSNGDMNFQK